MTTLAWEAIQFKCEKCGTVQYEDDTLDYGQFEDRTVREDHIQCEKCGYDNHVIQEL